MFEINNKDIGVVLVSLLLTYFTTYYSVSVVNFEHVIAGLFSEIHQMRVDASESTNQSC